MSPIQHPICNDILRRPEGTTEDQCADLPILRCDNSITSLWQPDAEELALIQAGAPILLTIIGQTHPPLLIHVLPQPEAATYPKLAVFDPSVPSVP